MSERARQRLKRRFYTILYKTAALLSISLLAAFHYSKPMCALRALPQTIRISDAQRLTEIFPASNAAALRVDAQTAERISDVSDTLYTFRLFGRIPLKTVKVVRTDDVRLIPGGSAVGITLHTAGVLLVGLGAVETEEGLQSPAAAAGLAAGDLIVSANGETVQSARHFSALSAASGGKLSLIVRRGDATLAFTVFPVEDSEEHVYRIGAWVRDSTAGVGTLSFCSAQGDRFAALGHAVSDVDTQSTLTVGSGRLLSAEIVDVIRGAAGEPGELLGVFSADGRSIGTIEKNTEFGVFGTLENADGLLSAETVPMAYAYEAHLGKATLLATVSGSEVAAFDCEITRVNTQQSPSVKGMIVTVTDERLLSTTGGIVQGMSGSPILQDGKLLGVVTHVFVNDPTKGYCIYAEWMAEQMRK